MYRRAIAFEVVLGYSPVHLSLCKIVEVIPRNCMYTVTAKQNRAGAHDVSIMNLSISAYFPYITCKNVLYKLLPV